MLYTTKEKPIQVIELRGVNKNLEKEKETLTSHKSATAGFTGKVGCITTTALDIFKVDFRTTQLKIFLNNLHFVASYAK